MAKTTLILSPDALVSSYAEPVLSRLKQAVGPITIIAPAEVWRTAVSALAETEIIFSGWGAPVMDEEFLRHVPKLRAIFYAGGSLRYFITRSVWERGIRVSTAQAINAIPVAEFTQAVIVLSLKRFWHYAQVTRTTQSFPTERPVPGAYRSIVGLISYGTIARQVRERLRSLEVQVVLFDPLISESEAASEGVRKVELDELFRISDVVSLHTPHFQDTAGMIRGRHLERLRPGATFINTARGEVVNEVEMVEVLRRRADIQAVLDVTAPEPPLRRSPLYTLANVILTPHIAGSLGGECVRMGLAMIDEYQRFSRGDPLQWEVTEARAAQLA